MSGCVQPPHNKSYESSLHIIFKESRFRSAPGGKHQDSERIWGKHGQDANLTITRLGQGTRIGHHIYMLEPEIGSIQVKRSDKE